MPLQYQNAPVFQLKKLGNCNFNIYGAGQDLMTFSAKALQNQYSVREMTSFPERSIFFAAVRSGFGVVSRTEYLFGDGRFGKMGGFPNGVTF